MIRRVVYFLFAFSIFVSLNLSRPQNAEAGLFDNFNLKQKIEELVWGKSGDEPVEGIKKPSIFQQIAGFFQKFSLKGAPKASPTPTPFRNPFPQPSASPTKEPQLPPERPLSPQQDGGPIKTSNASGKWVGRWTVNSPEACKGESGEWTANLVDSGGKLSGSFQSDAGGGSVSGTSANWSVGGGGGAISFRGAISGNTISGSFTGEVCDPQEAPQKTSGTFFGGRIVQ